MLPEGLQSLVSTSSLNSPLQSSQPPLPAQDDLRSEQNQIDINVTFLSCTANILTFQIMK